MVLFTYRRDVASVEIANAHRSSILLDNARGNFGYLVIISRDALPRKRKMDFAATVAPS